MQVQKLLEDNKSLQAAKDASDKQLSASYNDLSNEKMKCRKLEVQLAESDMASNQLKHKFDNLKSLHDSQTDVAMKAEAKAQQQSAPAINERNYSTWKTAIWHSDLVRT